MIFQHPPEIVSCFKYLGTYIDNHRFFFLSSYTYSESLMTLG